MDQSVKEMPAGYTDESNNWLNNPSEKFARPVSQLVPTVAPEPNDRHSTAGGKKQVTNLTKTINLKELYQKEL